MDNSLREQIIHCRDRDQYTTQPENDFTYCVDLPPGEYLRNVISEFAEKEMPKDKKIHISVGWANCSGKDQYCRKTGRDLARSRKTPIEFTVTQISINPGYFTMQVSSKEKGVSLHLHFVGNHVRVRGYSAPPRKVD